MTILNIIDFPNNITQKNEYSSEEILKILFQNLDYKVDFDYFSQEEITDLKLSSKNYDKISNLIDNLWI